MHLPRVVCARGDTADTWRPTMEFNRVDLPALGAPKTATEIDFWEEMGMSGVDESGRWWRSRRAAR